jgi:molybdopterin synthase sulfur carrier subunit
MLTIQYFASIREVLNRSEEQLELPEAITSVQGLIDHLRVGDPHFDTLFNDGNKVLVAVNQTVVDRNHVLSNDDEIAFFPPMTGG